MEAEIRELRDISMKQAKLEHHRRFFSIANQLRYVLISMVASSLLITGGLLTYLSFQHQLKQTKLLQEERSQSAADEISAYLDYLQRQLNYLSELQGLTEFPSAIQRSILEGVVNSNSAYEIVGILNNQGQAVQAMSPYEPVSSAQLKLANNVAQSPLFLEPFQDGKNYISAVEIDPKTQLPVATLAVPIRNQNNRIDGVLFAKINLNFLERVVSRTQVGQRGYTYVLDDRFVLIAQKGSTANTLQLQDLSGRSFIKHLAQLSLSPDTLPLMVYRGLNGQQVLGAATLVRRVQWTVVVELPTAEVYAPVYQMMMVMGGATLLITLVAVGLGFAFSRSIIVPLQHLTTAAVQLRDGNLNTRVAIVWRNELGELAKSFNSMAQQLQESFATLEAQNAEMNSLNQALSESEGRLTQFLDAMPVGVFVADAKGEPYYANQMAQQILGKGMTTSITVEEIPEIYQAYQAGSEQLYPAQRNPLLMALKGESHAIDDMEIRRSDKRIPIEAWGTPIYDECGNITFAIAAFQDITKRQQAEQLLAQYNQSLEQKVEERTQELSQALAHLQATQQELIQSEKMAALGQLVAGVAHEINTPLGAIRSSIENISDFLTNNLEQLPAFFQSLDQKQQGYFFSLLQKSIHQPVYLSTKEKRQLKRILKNQLESQGLANVDTLADTLVDVGIYGDISPFLPVLTDARSEYILNTVYQLASLQKSTQTIMSATDRAAKVVFALKTYARYDTQGIKIKAAIIDGIETVLTLYHNQLKQGVEVMRNYEANLPAILCYPDELNQVWTNLIHNALQAMEHQGTLQIDVRCQGWEILVSITDSGKGISPEVMPRIFDPFFTTKPSGEGSGLGLDIVRKIVDKHQGKIEVSSVPQRTTFTVYLPLS